MISMFTLSVVDCGFKTQSDPTKDWYLLLLS